MPKTPAAPAHAGENRGALLLTVGERGLEPRRTGGSRVRRSSSDRLPDWPLLSCARTRSQRRTAEALAIIDIRFRRRGFHAMIRMAKRRGFSALQHTGGP